MRKQAARHLFSALRPGDEAAVFSFDTNLDRVTPFTSDVALLVAALGKVQTPFGQTSLYDAVAQVARAVAAEGPGEAGCLSAALSWCSPTASTRVAA